MRTPATSQYPESHKGGGGDERIEHLLPKIFDNVQMKGWRDVNSNLDTSIVLSFFEEFFSQQDN